MHGVTITANCVQSNKQDLTFYSRAVQPVTI